jgi:predicted RNA-binding Zn-ribbon protein involved in translation (DUF1610 family)
MGGFLTFLVVLAGIIWLFRYLRQRELEAFLDEDISMFDDLPKIAQEHVAKVTATPSPTAVPSPEMPEAETQPTSAAAPAISLRTAVLDEIHRDVLAILESLISARYRIFVQMPLSDFLRTEGTNTQLYGKSISFLVCHREDFSVAFGIALRGAGQSELARFNHLEDVFSQIDRPLFSFPMIQGISQSEIRETLAPVIEDEKLSRNCPKCGQEMIMRKATRGKNVGKSFWVCREFPGCKGILRIGSPL